MDATAFDRDCPGVETMPKEFSPVPGTQEWTGKVAEIRMRKQEV